MSNEGPETAKAIEEQPDSVPRYKYVVEKASADVVTGNEQIERAGALEQAFKGKEPLPFINDIVKGEDFFMSGREEQKKGEVKNLIPDKYFDDDEAKKEISELVSSLKSGRSLNDLVNIARSEPGIKKLEALKLMGARLLQEHHPEEKKMKWEEMSETEKRTVRLAEMMVHEVEMEGLNRRLDDKEKPLDKGKAKTFERNYSRYAKNVDIPIEQKEKYRGMAERLRERMPDVKKKPVEVQEEAVDTTALDEQAEVLESKEVVVGVEEPQEVEEFNVLEMSSGELEERKKELLERRVIVENNNDPDVVRAREMIGRLEGGADFGDVVDEGYMMQGLQSREVADPKQEERRQRYLDILRNELGYGRDLEEGGLLNRAISEPVERAYARGTVGGTRATVGSIASFGKEYVVGMGRSLKEGREGSSERRAGFMPYNALKSVVTEAKKAWRNERDKRWQSVMEARGDVVKNMREMAIVEPDKTIKSFMEQLADRYDLINVRDKEKLQQGGEKPVVAEAAEGEQAIDAEVVSQEGSMQSEVVDTTALDEQAEVLESEDIVVGVERTQYEETRTPDEGEDVVDMSFEEAKETPEVKEKPVVAEEEVVQKKPVQKEEVSDKDVEEAAGSPVKTKEVVEDKERVRDEEEPPADSSSVPSASEAQAGQKEKIVPAVAKKEKVVQKKPKSKEVLEMEERLKKEGERSKLAALLLAMSKAVKGDSLEKKDEKVLGDELGMLRQVWRGGRGDTGEKKRLKALIPVMEKVAGAGTLKKEDMTVLRQELEKVRGRLKGLDEKQGIMLESEEIVVGAEKKQYEETADEMVEVQEEVIQNEVVDTTELGRRTLGKAMHDIEVVGKEIDVERAKKSAGKISKEETIALGREHDKKERKKRKEEEKEKKVAPGVKTGKRLKSLRKKKK